MRQSGGRGQFGHVRRSSFEPLEPRRRLRVRAGRSAAGARAEYVEGRSRQGIKEAMESGVDRRLPDGRHQGDARRRLAPRGRLERDGVQDGRLDGASARRSDGGPRMLEPIMKVEVTTPEEYMGDVDGRPEQPPRPDRGMDRARQRAGHHGATCRWRRCSATPPTSARRRRAARTYRWSSRTTRSCRRDLAAELSKGK